VSLRLVNLASEIESQDEFHIVRLLLLLHACSGRTNKALQGITKLAKLDFLLRYPSCLERVLSAVGRDSSSLSIEEDERESIESRMIRYRYGPWDDRYRRWIGVMSAKGLAHTYAKGRTVHVKLTESGLALAEELGQQQEFAVLGQRSRAVATAVGSFSATRLKDFVYEVFPEIVDMKWGESISI